MHETAIMRNLLGMVLSCQGDFGYTRVRQITVRAGEARRFDREFMQDVFDWFAEGTPAQGAKIELVECPIRYRCQDCGCESGMCEDGKAPRVCPQCASEKLKMCGGHELDLASIEVE